MASRIPPSTANAIAQKPENRIDIATPPSEARDAATTSDEPRPRMLDRDLAQRVGRRDAPGAASRGARPRAGRSGRPCRAPPRAGSSECAGANAGPTSPRSARTPTMSVRERAARDDAQRARRASDTSSASPAISRRICRGVAPSARSTAVSRRRWAMASANVPATTNRATAPAMPPSAPKMAISPARSAAVGSPASASAACRRSRTSIPDPRRSCRRLRRRGGGRAGLGDHADRVDPSGSAGQRRGDRGREEHGGLALVAARRARRRDR